LSCSATYAGAQEEATAKEPDPLFILLQMCDYLKSLQQFSFSSEVDDDQVLLGGIQAMLICTFICVKATSYFSAAHRVRQTG
jgi:hypothetical protein